MSGVMPQPHPQQGVINMVVPVMANPVPPANVQSLLVVAHPWTTNEPWDYTRTFELQVAGQTVRGHVHYGRLRQHANANGPFVNPAAYTAGPGNYWISGVQNWDAPTPLWLGQQFQAITNLERTNATNQFNNNHQAQLPLR
jgi:hypothetical protein